MVQREDSKEKKLLIKGKVNGEPMHTRFGGSGTRHSEVKFSIALSADVVANFKKSDPSIIPAGATLVVDCRSPCYIRNGDQVELIGRIWKITLKNGVVCHSITADNLFNASLQFSFEY
ncbi:MAG: hypothetical protein ACFFAJ_09690 [Candidatus Hodarchaeota archaeon]